ITPVKIIVPACFGICRERKRSESTPFGNTSTGAPGINRSKSRFSARVQTTEWENVLAVRRSSSSNNLLSRRYIQLMGNAILSPYWSHFCESRSLKYIIRGVLENPVTNWATLLLYAIIKSGGSLAAFDFTARCSCFSLTKATESGAPVRSAFTPRNFSPIGERGTAVTLRA